MAWFNRIPEIQRRFQEALVQSQVQQGSGEGSRKGSGEGREGFGGETGHIQQGYGEGLGGFGAEPGQVQPGSGESSRRRSGSTGFRLRFRGRTRRLWCRAGSGSTRFRRRFRRRSRRLWCRASRVQQGSGEGSGRLWCRAGSGPTEFGEGLVRFNRVPEKVLGEGLGGFGMEPGQVQQAGQQGSGGRRFRRRCGRLWCRAIG